MTKQVVCNGRRSEKSFGAMLIALAVFLLGGGLINDIMSSSAIEETILRSVGRILGALVFLIPGILLVKSKPKKQ